MVLHVDSRTRFTLLSPGFPVAPGSSCPTGIIHSASLRGMDCSRFLPDPGRTSSRPWNPPRPHGSRCTGPDFDFSLPHPSTLISTCQLLIFTKSHVRILKMFPPPDCISVSQQWSVYWTGCLVDFLSPPPHAHSFARFCHTPTTPIVTLYRTFPSHAVNQFNEVKEEEFYNLYAMLFLVAGSRLFC